MNPFEESLGSSPTLVGARDQSADAVLAMGAVLGNYRIVRPLGAGGMGAVYLAEHVEQKTRHALKTIRPEFAKQQNFAERFLREAKLAMRLKHPHIVACTDSGVAEGIPYLVMDYIEGPAGEPLNLRQLLDQRRERGELLDEDEAAAVGLEICKALDYAHSYRDAEIPNGIIHRDLKPANILLGKDTTLYIADFGLARLLGEKFEESVVQAHALSQSLGEQVTLGKQVSVSADTVGTFDYMSPEQREGRVADVRSDVFAMGVILYELLTGRKVIGVPAPPSKVRPELNPLWDEIILERALAYEPKERYATAGDFCRAIEGVPAMPRPAEPPALVSPPVVTAEPKPEKPVASSPATPPAEQPAAPQAAVEEPKPPEPKPPRSAGKVLAFAAVLVLVGLAVWWANSGQKQTGIAQKPTKETKTNSPVNAVLPPPSVAPSTTAVPLPENLRRGLVLHFSFDNVQGVKVIDESGTSNHGILKGGQIVPGKIGKALKCTFENKIDGVLVSNNPTLDLDAVTMAAWIKTDRMDEYWGRILDKDWRVAYNLCIGGDYDGKTTWRDKLVIDCAHQTVWSQRGVVDGQWHFVVGTFDGQTYKLYVDGLLDTSRVFPNRIPLQHSNSDLMIGNTAVNYNPSEILHYDGLLDEVRLYNRVLSEDEVRQLYEQGNTPSVTTIVPLVVPGQRWTNSLGMIFVPVPGTDVQFSIWDTRVQDYQAFVTATGRDWKKPDFEQGPAHPAVFIYWEDAKAFCAWLTEKERRDGRLTTAQEYRLPTDLEWSTAVGLQDDSNSTPVERAQKPSNIFPWGAQWPPPRNAGNYGSALYVDDFSYTSPVGSFAANQYGLYDMGGNVGQWCEDFYNGQRGNHVMRGSAWSHTSRELLLSSHRWSVSDRHNSERGGFRCVLAGGGVSVSQAQSSMGHTAAGSSTGMPAAAQTAPLPGYKLAWSDEFDGTTLDTTKWGYRFLGPRADGVNVEDAVTVANGFLTITSYTVDGKHFTAGISTHDKFERSFGCYEARIKFENSPGVKMQFWFESLSEGDPTTPVPAGWSSSVALHHVNHDSANKIQHCVSLRDAGKFKIHLTDDLGLANGFHLYGLEWTENEYRFFVDGKLTWAIAPTPISTQPHHIVLFSAVQEDDFLGHIPAAGYGSREKSKTKMVVDYVRYYERAEATR